MSQFDWPITKKNETMEAAQNRRFSFEVSIPPLLPTYIGGRRTTFAKAYGIEVRCYLELFGEHVSNLRTLCFDKPPPPPPKKKKIIHQKKKKKTPSSPHQKQKKKKNPHPPPPQSIFIVFF